VDIESITENESQVGAFLYDHLSRIAARTGGRVERMAVEGDRFNVLACWGYPAVTLSTHMDTVPPFFASSEDAEFIRGRGSCDAKGIIATMIAAAEKLLGEGVNNFALLFVVGEERNSAGAAVAALAARGSRYLVNGEPTENKLALASKGVLRIEVVAHGRMAHSAYPELGESAIEKLLDALDAIRKVPLPEDALMGRCTMNIGTIAGGRAPNVIPDLAKAEIMVRLVGDPSVVREAFAGAAAGRVELNEVLCDL
jgi:acetylornithine deacetylase